MQSHYNALGDMSLHEWSVVVAFSALILLWFFRQPKFMYGWGDSLTRMTDRKTQSTVADATPAMLMVILVFVLPIHYKLVERSASIKCMTARLYGPISYNLISTSPDDYRI